MIMLKLMILPLVALAQGPAKAPESALPVRGVTLFSSGVAYTQREGEVTGNATVPLMFRTTQINDILKSLVLIDEKGKVQPALYATKDPVSRTLQSFAVDVTQPLDRNALLNRLRGQVITASITSAKAVTGKLVSIEIKSLLNAEGKLSSVEFLNLLTDSGLKTLRLDLVDEISFEDPKVSKEFGEALTLLSTGADDKRRSVTLRFEGQGARRVQVGYISESPLWKMSYRLLLSGVREGATQPYLQGWALVENTTDEDWQGIALTLVSGRPISFIQDLYQPQYLTRPIVGADLTVSPAPQLAEAAIESRMDAPARAAIMNSMMRGQGGSFSGGRGGGMGGGGFGAQPVAPPGPIEPEAMAGSVTAQAAGEKQGELFTYKISTPVSLPRQQAAMIPVVAQDISGEKISLYNSSTDTRFPLHGVRLKNNTGLHLKGGPVTLFDGGTYAGDARMQDIPPGDSRILTYAVDLGLQGERQDKGGSAVETSLTIKRGVLTSSRKETTEVVYTFRNTSDKLRQVLVEHPYDPNFKLVAPTKFDERTPSLYRFLVPVAPGKVETLVVKAERPLQETYALLDAELDFIEVTTQRKEGVSPKLKAALEDVLTRRRKLQDLQSQIAERENEVKQIEQDQNRIRQNMNVLDRNSESYKNYVKQLDAQELRIQELRKQSTTLRTQLATSERELKAFIDKLEV
jgi:hypothetical protein